MFLHCVMDSVLDWSFTQKLHSQPVHFTAHGGFTSHKFVKYFFDIICSSEVSKIFWKSVLFLFLIDSLWNALYLEERCNKE